MGTIVGSDYKSSYTGDEIDAAIAASRNSAGVTGILKGAGNGTYTEQLVDATPTSASTNPVQSGGVFEKLAEKQDTITYTDISGNGDVVIS